MNPLLWKVGVTTVSPNRVLNTEYWTVGHSLNWGRTTRTSDGKQSLQPIFIAVRITIKISYKTPRGYKRKRSGYSDTIVGSWVSFLLYLVSSLVVVSVVVLGYVLVFVQKLVFVFYSVILSSNNGTVFEWLCGTVHPPFPYIKGCSRKICDVELYG